MLIPKGASVEAEVGTVGGNEAGRYSWKFNMPDPQECLRYG